MKQKSVGLTLRALIIALALILVAGSPALPPFDGVAYAQTPAAPTNFTATVLPGGGSVALSWNAVTGADSYQIAKANGSGDNAVWGTIPYATVTADSDGDGAVDTVYSDTDVTADGSIYTYTVRAVINGSTSDWAVPTATVTMPGGVSAPTAKSTVTAAAGTGLTTIDVSWTAVAGATSYDVWVYSSVLGANWITLVSGTTDMTYEHTGLTSGSTYWYTVRGVNSAGNGPWSDYDSHTLIATTSVPVITLTRVDRTTVKIDWTPTATDAQYDLERRKLHVASGSTETTEGAWARLPDGLLTATTYTDSAANYVPTDAVSVKYEYRVQARDSDGNNPGLWSKVKTASIPKAGVVLPKPTDLSASTLTATSIQLSWTAVDGAEFYQLQWKSGDRAYSSPIRVNASTYEDTGLSPATKYTYQVRAVDVNGASDWSSATSATTRSTSATAGQMPKVTGLTVTDATGDNAAPSRVARLAWDAVSGVTHYEIMVFDPGVDNAAWARVSASLSDAITTDGFITKSAAKSPPTVDLTISTGAQGKTYYYIVSAIDDGVDNTPGNTDDDMGEWSDYKSVTFKDFKPDAPSALAATKTTGTSIWLSWTAPTADNDSGTAASYNLQWRTGQSSTWTSIAVSGTTHHHTGLSGSTSYTYRVRAENSGGESEYHPLATETQVTVVLGNTLPAPSGVKAADATSGTGDSAEKIKVSWSAVSGASGYEIQRYNTTADPNHWGNLAGGEANSVTTVSSTSTTDNAASLAPSTTYLYRVRTVKEELRSGWSAVVSGTTRAATATAPALDSQSTGMTTIRLSWKAVPGATTYELQWLEGSHVADTFNNDTISRSEKTISGNLNNYVHTGRKVGALYSYRLRATLPEGAVSGWSSVEKQYTKPPAPNLTTSNVTNVAITLKWDAVAFVTDAGADGKLGAANNYRVEWRKAGSSAWAPVEESITCTDNKCSVIDAGLTKNTRYYYRVRATVTRTEGTYTSYWDYADNTTTNN